jgi:hypothetical protein
MKRNIILLVACVIFAMLLYAVDDYGCFENKWYRQLICHYSRNEVHDLGALKYRPGVIKSAHMITRPVSGAEWYLRYSHPEIKSNYIDIILDKNCKYITYRTVTFAD